jgi:hypothetical protein
MQKSMTVTVKAQTVVFPVASLAVQFTVVTPTGKMEPLGGVQTTLAAWQLSTATGGA